MKEMTTTSGENNEGEEVICNQTKELDMSLFRASKSKSIGKATDKEGVLSLINSKNGKRLTLCEELMEGLNQPQSLQISFSAYSVLIGEKLPDNESQFSIRKCGKKSVIYSSELVDEITNEFNLDFSDKTSMTFHDVEYSTIEGCPAATIKITK